MIEIEIDMDTDGIFPNFLEGDVNTVAPRLLGCELERTINSQTIRVRIVEVESYDQEDMASHAYGGPSKRNAVMFGPAGHLYVYFTYGMHYCCNVVTGMEGYGSGVLIRAVEPLDENPLLIANRHGITGHNLTNGPAKLCQALAIDGQLGGHNLHGRPLRLIARPTLAPSDIVITTRIGISKAVDSPRRFYIKDNPFVSRP
ncbi:MAG TPA: DNA-3-methyladenine glycosylase [Candidatus Saccharimonadales bacterium]|nr:DNA-3-methyladenine glycosylase [Candidatus Saccharimonadales bacterium]